MVHRGKTKQAFICKAESKQLGAFLESPELTFRARKFFSNEVNLRSSYSKKRQGPVVRKPINLIAITTAMVFFSFEFSASLTSGQAIKISIRSTSTVPG